MPGRTGKLTRGELALRGPRLVLASVEHLGTQTRMLVIFKERSEPWLQQRLLFRPFCCAYVGTQFRTLLSFEDCEDKSMTTAWQTDREQGNWIPANGGAETPFKSRRGATLLYCYQPSTGRHAYLNVDTDMILTDEEALILLGLINE